MIVIEKSKTADTRSCDYATVTKEILRSSSIQHIRDVEKGLNFFRDMLEKAAVMHDMDKLTDIDGFHADFLTGFKVKEWWERHKILNRHHLLKDGHVPDDVNLVDVIEMVVDCVMAGMGRTGTTYPLSIDPDVLMKAFQNTTELMKSNVMVSS